MSAQLDLFSAPPPSYDKPDLTPREVGHAAAKLAAERADREKAEWISKAYAAFVQYARQVYPATFITKDAREFAEGQLGVPPPPERRSWGHIALRAKAAREIAAVGSVEARHVHGSTVTEWRATGA